MLNVAGRANNAEDGEDEPDLFDFDGIEKYCHHFGLAIQADYDAVKWTVLKDRNTRKEVSEYVQKHLPRKPWWKFW